MLETMCSILMKLRFAEQLSKSICDCCSGWEIIFLCFTVTIGDRHLDTKQTYGSKFQRKNLKQSLACDCESKHKYLKLSSQRGTQISNIKCLDRSNQGKSFLSNYKL